MFSKFVIWVVCFALVMSLMNSMSCNKRPEVNIDKVELEVRHEASERLAAIPGLEDVSCTDVQLFKSSDGSKNLEGIAELSNGVTRHVEVKVSDDGTPEMWVFK